MSVKLDLEFQVTRSMLIIVDYSALRRREREYTTRTLPLSGRNRILLMQVQKQVCHFGTRVSLLSLGGGRGWLTPNCRTDPDTPRGSTRPPPCDRFTLPLSSRVQAQIPTTRNVIVVPTNELPSFNFIVGCINYNYVYFICLILSFLKINNIFFKSFDNYSLRLVLK